MGQMGITEEFGRGWGDFGGNSEGIEEFGRSLGRNGEEFGKNYRI